MPNSPALLEIAERPPPQLPDNGTDSADNSEDQSNTEESSNDDAQTEEGVVVRQLAVETKRVTLQARRLAAAFRRSEIDARETFEDDLVEAFERARQARQRRLLAPGRPLKTAEIKQERPDLTELTDTIDVPEWTALYLRRAYNTLYLDVMRAVVDDIERVMGVAVNLPDPVQRTIIDMGGTRLGLLDVQRQLQSSVYETIAAGRAAGHNPDVIARRIESAVPAGRFTIAGAEYRAQLIARTETRYAQNVSSLHASRGIDGVGMVMLLDAQAGPTDEICEARNGRIVSFQDAERILLRNTQRAH